MYLGDRVVESLRSVRVKMMKRAMKDLGGLKNLRFIFYFATATKNLCEGISGIKSVFLFLTYWWLWGRILWTK
jgi:hypothetical protein